LAGWIWRLKRLEAMLLPCVSATSFVGRYLIGIGRIFLFTTTLKHCEVDNLEQLTSFTVDFPVKVSALQDKGKGKMMNGIFGRSFRGWSEKLNRIGLWVKTYLGFCPLPLTIFVRIWSGRATQSGFFVMKLRLSERRTGEHECFLWRTPDANCARGAQSPERFAESMKTKKLLTLNDQVAHSWATPKTSDTIDEAAARRLNQAPEKTTHLSARVRLFPTPRAADGAKGQRTPKGAEKEVFRGHGIDLPMFAQLYPTPTVHGDYNRKGSSAKSGNGLATFVKQQMLPTPTVNDSKNNSPPSQRTENGRHSNPLNVLAGGALNPAWVEWLMGFPAGWTALGGDMHPTYQE
jgi:hypothetical protein